jgi:hypothetical protein
MARSAHVASKFIIDIFFRLGLTTVRAEKLPPLTYYPSSTDTCQDGRSRVSRGLPLLRRCEKRDECRKLLMQY